MPDSEHTFFGIAAILLLVVFVVLASPVYLVLGLRKAYLSWSIRRTLRRAWPADTWILLSYTQSPHWAPYLESHVIPRLGQACVVVDRSQSDWKHTFPGEARAIEFWGGQRAHNPLVILFPQWRRTKVVRLYDAFLDHKHGKDGALNSTVERLFLLVDKYTR